MSTAVLSLTFLFVRLIDAMPEDADFWYMHKPGPITQVRYGLLIRRGAQVGRPGAIGTLGPPHGAQHG